ncbi:MAG: SCO family protein [Nitrospirales bacterium]|nr:SCO family protein [Nitrospirales bacterium]
MEMGRILAVCFAFLLSGAASSPGHEKEVSPREQTGGAGSQAAPATGASDEEAPGEVGIVERLGQYAALDAVFHDEEGRARPLRQWVDRPVILSLIYFDCDRICPQFLGGLAEALEKATPVPGKEYRVLTISFDPKDTPRGAHNARRNYLKAMGSGFPGEAWRFLVGDAYNIQKLLDSVGFSIKGEGLHGFSHPTALIVLSPEGKIVRYLYTTNYAYGAPSRITFLPFDLSMAVSDAAKGKVVQAVKADGAYCLPRQSKGQQAFFTILKIFGAATLLLLTGALIGMILAGRKIRRRDGTGK